MLYHVSWSDIPKAWKQASDLLEKAIEYSDGDYVIEDIYHELMNGTMQLFVWDKNGEITTAAITKIIKQKHKTICTMPLVSGSNLRDWSIIEGQIIKFAKEQKCSQIEGYCRDGWLRILKNWKKVWTTMRRDI